MKVGHTLAYAAQQVICTQTPPQQINAPLKKYGETSVGEWKPTAEARRQEFPVRFEDRGGESFVVTS